MIEHDIIKSETYKYLIILNRQFIALPKDSFPCSGATQLWSLLYNLINKILERIDRYSTRQLRLITTTLLPEIDELCKQLNNSVTSKVPWSLLPSLESVFSTIRKDAKFIITPQWKTNYSVFNKNIIKHLIDLVFSIPDLVFDSGASFEKEKEAFFLDVSEEIYMLHYPRSERLTPLHFPLLGHEIGHIFAAEWIQGYYQKKLDKYDLENKIDLYIKGNLPPGIKGQLFEPQYIITMKSNIFNTFKRIAEETIADCVGGIIFGPAALLSSFVFCLNFGYDDFDALKFGYLPWRYRLYLLSEVLISIGTLNFQYDSKGARQWIKDILQITNGYDYMSNLRQLTHESYCRFIFEIFMNEIKTIGGELIGLIPKPHYADVGNATLQEEVVRRLSNGVIPNCTISNNLAETPIDFRNIIAGTWLYLCKQNLSETVEFNKISKRANLLSLKAIELSHMQQKVINGDD